MPWWETCPVRTLLSLDLQVLPAPCVLPMGSLLWALTSSSTDSIRGCRWITALLWTSMGTAVSPYLSPWTAGEWISGRTPGLQQLLPSLLHWPWYMQNSFSYTISLPLPCPQFASVQELYLILKPLPSWCCHCHWWAQPSPAVSWSQLALALDMWGASSSFEQKPPL